MLSAAATLCRLQLRARSRAQMTKDDRVHLSMGNILPMAKGRAVLEEKRGKARRVEAKDLRTMSMVQQSQY